MFLELVATFVAGIGVAGMVLLLGRFWRGLPGWAAPVAAGAAMIAVAVASEYSWAGRTADGLGDGVVVVDEVAESAWWRPWTYLAPVTTRIMALDTASIQTNDAAPDTRLVGLYMLGRWQPVVARSLLLRCVDPARADATPAALDDPAGADWRPVEKTSPLIRHACEE